MIVISENMSKSWESSSLLDKPKSGGGGGDAPHEGGLDVGGLKAEAGAEEIGDTRS